MSGLGMSGYGSRGNEDRSITRDSAPLTAPMPRSGPAHGTPERPVPDRRGDDRRLRPRRRHPA